MTLVLYGNSFAKKKGLPTQFHFKSIVLLLPRYVFDENGINLSLQAAGAVIRDSFNDLGTRGCQIADRSGDVAPSLYMQDFVFFFQPAYSGFIKETCLNPYPYICGSGVY